MPRVVIVGRPNAGKSTLFNRLAGRRKALVDRTPGLTRDLNIERVSWRGRWVEVVDTGGLTRMPRGEEGVERQVLEQCLGALEGAAAVICLFDGRAGWSAADEETVRLLRKRGAKVIWAVNKIDSGAHEARVAEFYRCGSENLIGISAEHGRGIDDLIDCVLRAIPEAREEESPAEPLRIAIVGRPNVGKSSLLNRLLGKPRAIVDSRAGTTRDALDSPFSWRGKRYLLVDTAGMRRPARVAERLERAFVKKAIESLERCDVALVVMDASAGITSQDLRLCRLALRRGRGIVVVMNKIDLVDSDGADFGASLEDRSPIAAPVPVVAVSALVGTNLDEVMPAVERVASAHSVELDTPGLNRVLSSCVQAHQPPTYRGRPTKLFYAAQVGRKPPRVVVFCNYPKALDAAYTRYLEKQLSAAFGLVGTSVVVSFRKRR